MKKYLCSVAIVMSLMAATGCEEQQAGEDPLTRLYRANQEQQRMIQSQAKTIQLLGLTVVMLGGGLATTLAVTWRKGRQLSEITKE